MLQEDSVVAEVVVGLTHLQVWTRGGDNYNLTNAFFNSDNLKRHLVLRKDTHGLNLGEDSIFLPTLDQGGNKNKNKSCHIIFGGTNDKRR